MPHNIIRSLHGLLQWPFLKISLFRGAVTTCSRFWSKDFGEAYSIHKIRGISCDKSSASRFLFHSEQDFDYPVSWLARSCSNFSYDTNRKRSFGQTIFCTFDYIWNGLLRKLYLGVLSQYVHTLVWRGNMRERVWS